MKERTCLRTAIVMAGIIISVSSTSCNFEDLLGEKSQSYQYSEGTPYVKLGDGVTTLTLTGMTDKTLIFANVNPTDSVVYSSFARTLTNATARSAEGTREALAAPIVSAEQAPSALEADDSWKIRDFVPPQVIDVNNPPAVTRVGASRSVLPAPSASISGYTDNFDINNLTTDGNTYRYVYVDNAANPFTYVSKKVTLRAIGTDKDSKDSCLVWVDDDCFKNSGDSSGKYINTAVAVNIASTFAEHYLHERSVFGEEADVMYTKDASGWGTSPLNDSSDTKTYVNIVVYDIGADYGKSDMCGVVGYFYAKDYYETAAQMAAAGYSYDSSSDSRVYSNGGKYFYLDAPFCNLSGNDGTQYLYKGVESGTKASDTAISTLFHEFQHMIDFNQKNVKCNLSVPAWYNEMLSMLAEDMMQKQIGTNDLEAPRGSRLPGFNMYYIYSGSADWLGNTYSYSSMYAFGAWLARAYGGPQLVSKMSQNNSQGMSSILAAIKAQTRETVTSDALLEKYIQACVYRNPFASKHSLPTFNKAAGNDIEANGYTSTMTAIDLFGSDYSNTISGTTYYGPLLFTSSAQFSVRPHGFVLHLIGQSSYDTVELTFSSQLDSNEEVYVYIQD